MMKFAGGTVGRALNCTDLLLCICISLNDCGVK